MHTTCMDIFKRLQIEGAISVLFYFWTPCTNDQTQIKLQLHPQLLVLQVKCSVPDSNTHLSSDLHINCQIMVCWQFHTEKIKNTRPSRMSLYFVSSQEQQWRHWSCQRIYTARRILLICVSPGILFEHVRKTHIVCARAIRSNILCNTRWRRGRSWDETKYRYLCVYRW